MIYKIDIDGKALYRNVDELNVINPKLTLEDNNSGSLTFKLPSNHPRYNDIKMMKSELIVYRDNKEIWRGRPTLITEDFYKNKKVECEGELAYLNDVIQPQKKYQNYTPDRFLRALITEYNKRCDTNRKFTVGKVTVTDKNDSILRYTNWDNTLECINDKLIKQFGGHLRIRHVGNTRYLDYLQNWTGTNSQIIRFGVNIVDFSTNYDVTDIATAIIPLGARQEKKTIEALEEHLTIKSVNNGSVYLSNTNAVKEFGWIEKVVKWDDVTIAKNLKSKGEKYLKDYQFDKMQLELTAVDLANLEVEYDGLELLQQVRVKSTPHGLDRLFPITKMQLSLDNPAKDTLTLGVEESKSLTTKNSQISSDINRQLEETATISSVKEEATKVATELIKGGITGGYVVTTPNEILIMNNKDKSKATKVWRWNVNGLGYSKNGYNGTYGTAITMNGQIVADYITAGTLSADRIKGGALKLGGSGYNTNGKLTVVNKNNKTIVQADNNGLTATAGTVGGWTLSNNRMYYKFNSSNKVQLGGIGVSDKSHNIAIGAIDENKGVYKWNITSEGIASSLNMNYGNIKDNVTFDYKTNKLSPGNKSDVFTTAVRNIVHDYLMQLGLLK